MRYRLTLPLCLIACTVALTSRAAGNDNAATPTLTVPGQFSLGSPGDGFVWHKVREQKQQGGLVVLSFLATREGSPEKVVLVVEQGAAADSDAKRTARIKGDYNGLLTGLRASGHTELKGSPPTLATPIPKEVSFDMSGKDKAGQAAAFRGVVVFGAKNVYHFQVAAPTADRVAELSKVVETLK
ncbi:MAG TPA: hypothetical protein VH475_11730 [Tepidisphaeraceae bacterium]